MLQLYSTTSLASDFSKMLNFCRQAIYSTLRKCVLQAAEHAITYTLRIKDIYSCLSIAVAGQTSKIANFILFENSLNTVSKVECCQALNVHVLLCIVSE